MNPPKWKLNDKSHLAVHDRCIMIAKLNNMTELKTPLNAMNTTTKTLGLC